MYNYPWIEYKGRSYYRWDTNNVCEGPKNKDSFCEENHNKLGGTSK